VGPHCHHGPVGSSRLALFTAKYAATTAGVLVILKIWAWLTTNAISMQASLLDSAIDCLSSICAIFGLHFSQRPAQPPYVFGLQKVEPLVALGQAALVVGSALFLGTESLHRLISPEPLENAPVGLAVSLIAIVLTTFLVCVQRYAIRRTHSVIIQADSLHYRVDLFTNLGIIASLSCSHWFNIFFIDSIFGLGAALYISVGAVRLIRHSAGELLDKGLSEEESTHFQQLIEEQPGITRVLWLRTRKASTTIFIFSGVEVSVQTVPEALQILKKAKEALKAHAQNIEVFLLLED
jgi:ferrous-iron efflux pump FieF